METLVKAGLARHLLRVVLEVDDSTRILPTMGFQSEVREVRLLGPAPLMVELEFLEPGAVEAVQTTEARQTLLELAGLDYFALYLEFS
jgi:hypothetical protein